MLFRSAGSKDTEDRHETDTSPHRRRGRRWRECCGAGARLYEECDIIIFERGPHVSFANCGLPYFVGGEIADEEKLLVQTPERLRARFNLDLRVNTEVTAIDRPNCR
jgi:NADPH-dependent 2,4-dienoyl-CoA reductase/sulfur reductase-like enzyme